MKYPNKWPEKVTKSDMYQLEKVTCKRYKDIKIFSKKYSTEIR